MRKLLIVIPALLIVSAGAVSTYVRIRESLEQQRASIAASWSAVDEALQSRAALVRELARAAGESGVAAPELIQETGDAQTRLAQGGTRQDRIRANERLNSALARLLLATEAPPGHKPNRTLSRLEEQIRDAEEHIAIARRKYNETLEHYNARIQSFPYNLVAKIAGYARDDAYFFTEPF